MRSLASILALVAVAPIFQPPSARAQGPPPMLVETAPVEEVEFHDQVTLVGRTEARAESRIVAEVSGRVYSVDAGEGQRVRRGAPLATIDSRRLALALEAKRAEAAQAKAEAELADKELARARELVSTQIFPARNLDSAVAEAASKAERYKQLDAECRQLELDLENCVIRSPYDGYTVRKLVDVGEWVDPGTPVYETVDLSMVNVTVDLPERRFGELDRGSPATIVRSGDGGQELAGKVTGIAPRASETTHTFPVTLTVANAGGHLGSGMLVRVTLDLRATFRGLAVSKDAIVRQGERTSVYTVVDGSAVEVPVRILAQRGDRVAIEATAAAGGLAAGQSVVVRGNERLIPGSPVRVTGAGGTP